VSGVTTGTTAGESAGETEVSGALVGVSEVEIAAPVELVWEVLTAFHGWPSWNSDVKSMSVDGDLVVGSVFRWKSGPGTITSTIRHVDPPRGIAWSGKTMGIRAYHVWRLEPRDGGAFVRTEESFDGLLARLFRGPLRRALDEGLQSGLDDLKAEAEARAAANG